MFTGYISSRSEGMLLIQQLIRDLPCANAHTLQYLWYGTNEGSDDEGGGGNC